VERLLTASWGSTTVVSRGVIHDAAMLPAFVATRGGSIVGLAAYSLGRLACELVSLDATERHRGIGSALLERVAEHARGSGCERLWLITTNDNLDALRFYQRRGLRIVAVHRGAVDHSRRIKPSIPLHGEYGIPIQDELELELILDPA
jgi:GNAT superfamily N-acetyltransferase